MALVQGYSSSDEEGNPESSSVVPTFPPLPRGSSSKGASRSKLPLLEEVADNSSDSEEDEEKDVVLSVPAIYGDGKEGQELQLQPIYELNKNLKRRRVSDDDEDRPSTIPVAPHQTKVNHDYVSIEAADNADSTATEAEVSGSVAPTEGMQAVLNSPELLADLKNASTFSELSTDQIRQDAKRFQQGGVAINLGRSKGVSGRQNHIGHLAQVALKDREGRN